MLYIFKSKAAGDLILLQANGERILQIIGKEAGAKGIILPEQMPAAIAALEKAIAAAKAPVEKTAEPGAEDTIAAADRVTLHQRAVPFIDMLRRCQAAGKEIVWGV
jgi:predicted nicotinamide N-methyase